MSAVGDDFRSVKHRRWHAGAWMGLSFAPGVALTAAAGDASALEVLLLAARMWLLITVFCAVLLMAPGVGRSDGAEDGVPR